MKFSQEEESDDGTGEEVKQELPRRVQQTGCTSQEKWHFVLVC